MFQTTNQWTHDHSDQFFNSRCLAAAYYTFPSLHLFIGRSQAARWSRWFASDRRPWWMSMETDVSPQDDETNIKNNLHPRASAVASTKATKKHIFLR